MNKLTRTMLYIPGNNPAMLQNAMIFGADTVLFDLEDAVAISQKDAARDLVRNMLSLKELDRNIISVRINPLNSPFGFDDLKSIIPLHPGAIRAPKIETAEDIHRIEEEIEKIEKAHNLTNKISIHPLIESPIGVENALKIATASKRVETLTFGAQDLTAAMGIKTTQSGQELLYTRQRIVMAAKAAGIKVLDTVYTDITNLEGLKAETEFSKSIGFDGKGVIHPSQIEVIHEVFKPSRQELDYAKRVIKYMEENKKQGSGVFSLDGKMIDAPVVKRAETLIRLARLYGM